MGMYEDSLKAQYFEKERTIERLSEGSSQEDHILKAKYAVLEYWKESDYVPTVHLDDVYMVHFTYILGNWKALISSDAWTDTSYFEVTYNKAGKCLYVDHYRKVRNVKMSEDPLERLREKLL